MRRFVWKTGGFALSALVLGACAGSAPPEAESVSPGVLEGPPAGVVVRREPVVESVEPWTFDSAVEGSIIRTRHYRIFTTEGDAALLDRLPGFCEGALAHYRAALGPLPAPPVRLDTYLMDNRPQWVRLAQRLTGQQDAPQLQIRRGGFATRGVGVFYDIGLFDTLAIAAHEGWHQYTQRTFREPLPVWLEEGVATFMEGHKWDGADPLFLPWANVERYDRLRQAYSENRLLPLRTLVSTTPQELIARRDGSELTYYAQVWAVVHFLNESGEPARRAALRAMLRDAAAGRLRATLAAAAAKEGGRADLTLRAGGGGAVLEAYLGESLASVEREYARFIEIIVQPGGRDRIVSGRGPAGAVR